MEPGELDDLFRKAREMRPAPSAAFQRRILADALGAQPRLKSRRKLVEPGNLWALAQGVARQIRPPAALLPLAASLVLLIQSQDPNSTLPLTDPIWEIAQLAGEDDPDVVFWLSGWPESTVEASPRTEQDDSLSPDL